MPWAGEKTVVETHLLKPRTKAKVMCYAAVSLLLVFGGIVTKYKISIVFGVLYLLALMMKKSEVITSRGLEQYFKIFFIEKHYIFGWENVSQMVVETIKGNSNLKAVHIFVGDRDKKEFVKSKDVDKVVKLATIVNENLPVEYLSKK